MLTFSIQDIPPFHLAAGNPARIIRKIVTLMDPSQRTAEVPARLESADGARKP